MTDTSIILNRSPKFTQEEYHELLDVCNVSTAYILLPQRNTSGLDVYKRIDDNELYYVGSIHPNYSMKIDGGWNVYCALIKDQMQKAAGDVEVAKGSLFHAKDIREAWAWFEENRP